MIYRSALNGDRPGSYQLATRSGKTTINSGETLEFEQYVTGYGYIQTPKLQAYISTDAFELEKSYILNSLVRTDFEGGFKLSWGNQKDKLSPTGFTFLMQGMSCEDGDESTMIFDALSMSKNPILLSEQKLDHAPFEYTLKTKKSLSPGEHYIDFYLTFFNGERWVTSKERVSFKIRNIFERHAKKISALAVIASVSGILRFIVAPIYNAFF
ncbi:hypothetical protein [Pseudomonas sp. TB1-B1]|uniref:hypothetical protein n=1 Tax=Pseudomonas sp. TB1-B1 TaxID=2985515 RepID=UPI00226D51AE|nr:hypothetical protein [Pseudomonas sp. TB1-B1]MCX9150514.1 hypothetical protein [Pseudomonas sp. TB1-B1]